VLVAFLPLLILTLTIVRSQFDYLKFLDELRLPCSICCHSIITAGVVMKLVGMGLISAAVVALVIQNPLAFNLIGLLIFTIVFDGFSTNTLVTCDTGRANSVLQSIVASVFNLLIFAYFASQILPIFPNMVQVVAGVEMWNLVQLLFNAWLFWRIIARRQVRGSR